MRIYKDERQTELTEAVCNACGKKLALDNGIVKEGCFTVDAAFGYFSEKDGMRHQFDLCEECYDKMIAKFRIPVTEKEVKELL